jgi:hypothetical protein
VPDDDFATLLKWVHARLEESAEGAAAPVLAPHAAADPALLRGRQRVTALAKRVAAELAVPGWRVEPLRWSSEANAVLTVRGSDDARVEVRFAIGARGKRSTVGIDFHPVEANAEGVKPVIESLLALLREPAARAAPGDEREALRA